jgi:hypothetical protein
MILNEDYEVALETTSDIIQIVLKKEPFKDVMVNFSNLNIKDDTDKSGLLTYDYSVINPQQYEYQELEENEQFAQYLIDVMRSIIEIIANNLEIKE